MKKDTLVIIGIRSHVVCIDTTSGNERWRTKLKGSQFITIYQRGDRIFAGAQGELYCLRASTGAILWHNKLKKLGYGLVSFGADGPRSDRRDLIIGIKGTVVSINAWTGDENWRSQLSNGGQAVTLLNQGARQIIAGHHGELYAVDRTGGRILWNSRLKGLGYGLVTLGGNETAIAQAIAQAQAAGAAAASSAAS